MVTVKCILYFFPLIQAITMDEIPSLSDWLGCEYPLCSTTVDNDKKIEDAGSRALQVRT